MNNIVSNRDKILQLQNLISKIYKTNIDAKPLGFTSHKKFIISTYVFIIFFILNQNL